MGMILACKLSYKMANESRDGESIPAEYSTVRLEADIMKEKLMRDLMTGMRAVWLKDW